MSKEVEIVGEAYFSPDKGEDKNEFLEAILEGDIQHVEKLLGEYRDGLSEECLKLIRGLSYFFYGQKLIEQAKKIVSKNERESLREDGIGWIGCGWYFLENLAIEAGCPISPNPFARDE